MKILLKFRSRKNCKTITDSHWLICLGFRLARTVLPRSGGDALGVMSRRKDARAEGSTGSSSSSSSTVTNANQCRLLFRSVDHVCVLVFVVGVVRLELAVRACALLRGTHEGLRVRVLHKECRRRDVLVGDVRGGS